jgi:hypothetical protein
VAEAAEALRYLVETVGCLNEPWSAFFVSLFRLPLELDAPPRSTSMILCLSCPLDLQILLYGMRFHNERKRESEVARSLVDSKVLA